jgi:hypothetical protein
MNCGKGMKLFKRKRTARIQADFGEGFGVHFLFWRAAANDAGNIACTDKVLGKSVSGFQFGSPP